MKKIAFHQTLENAYSIIDSNLVELKSAMIGLCTDIERYFKVAFDINLNEEIDDDAFRRMLYVFPRFGSLTIEQINKYLLLFVNIRNVNAHLYLSRPIFIDDDLKQFIVDNVNPTYPIEYNKKITVYGAILVLAMMSQKYMVWPFCTSFLRHEFFVEIGKGDVMSQFQIGQQKIFNSICGTGKPLTQNSERVSGVEAVYLNDVLKRCLTLVFFDLEKVLKNYRSCYHKTSSLSSMLRNNPLFNEELISRIIKLRNCWFHGTFIGDVVKDDGVDFKFTLEFAIDTLGKIAETAKKDIATLGLVANDIGYFAQNFLNYYVLRLVEVSFKILDRRLLTEDKLEGRLDNMNNAYQRFAQVDTNLFDLFSHLVNNETIRWSVGASKFLDKLPRKFDSKNLKIAKIHCENGFMIGDFKTNRTDIVLALNEVDGDYKNLINGLDFYGFNGVTERECSKYITVIKVEL